MIKDIENLARKYLPKNQTCISKVMLKIYEFLVQELSQQSEDSTDSFQDILADSQIRLSLYSNLLKSEEIQYCQRIKFFQNLIRLLKKSPEIPLINNQEKISMSIDHSMHQEIVEISILSEKYPELLRNISDPPVFLYCWGDQKLLRLPKISIVGTRKNTELAELHVAKLIRIAKLAGKVSVSGLAIGVDTLVHQKSLENNLKTIAVLPMPIDRIVPSRNEKLAKEIVANNGLIISELSPNSDVSFEKYTFPRRNRIIAGLSEICVVVEAPNKSGAAITAQLAFEADRQVFVAFPHFPNNYQGNLNLVVRKQAEILAADYENLAMELDLPNLQNLISHVNTPGLKKIEKEFVLELAKGNNQIITIGKALHLDQIELDKIVFELRLRGIIELRANGILKFCS